jgi:hypothetical protein
MILGLQLDQSAFYPLVEESPKKHLLKKKVTVKAIKVVFS